MRQTTADILTAGAVAILLAVLLAFASCRSAGGDTYEGEPGSTRTPSSPPATAGTALSPSD